MMENGKCAETKEKPEDAEAWIGIFSYEEMEQEAEKKRISQELLEEARHFGFAKYDSYENFDCISIELQNFENMVSLGSVIIYLEKNCAYFFTSQKKFVTDFLRKYAEGLGEKVNFNRMIYGFLDMQTKKEQDTFDKIEREILGLEQSLITSKNKNYVGAIIGLRKRLLMMKRYYEQFLNVLDSILENENNIFDGRTLRSLKMLSRRMERSYGNILNLREYVTQVRESYEAEVDISLNTTMKIVTVVTTIFLPLTVIAGWYGMNFQMPEYKFAHGYLMVILLSILFIGIGIAFFKKNHWF